MGSKKQDLSLSSYRASLPANPRYPYWKQLKAGRHLGFRKLDGERSSWHARWYGHNPNRTDSKGNPIPGNGYRFKDLGDAQAMSYDDAVDAALQWFADLDGGVAISKRSYSVADACREYVEDRRREKGEDCAHDAEKRFERTVFGTAFGNTELAKLRTPVIKKWREGLGLKKGTANRTMTSLRAALNLAVTNRHVAAAQKIEWETVKQYKGADGRREIYLDLQQRRALLAAAEGNGALRDLMEGVMVTGARAGELARALRRQFDGRTRTLTLRSGKSGERTVPLSPAALVLFDKLSKSKLPGAYLFTRDDGKPWAHSDWDELVRAAADAAVVKDAKGNPLKDEHGREVKLPKGVCLYVLRHSWITQAISDGMTTLDVARLVGTSVQMIEKHYGHLVASAAAERLAKVSMV